MNQVPFGSLKCKPRVLNIEGITALPQNNGTTLHSIVLNFI